MDLRNLRAFRAVVERGGFSKAAKALGSTQPTVSKAVARLEHACGAPLLERSGAGVAGTRRLTAAGEAVYRRCVTILREQEELTRELAEIGGMRRGRLSLGLPPLGSGVLFAGAVAAYRQRHPEVEIELREAGGRKLEQAVLAGELELAITLLPVMKGCAWKALRREPLMALLPPGFAWPEGEPIRLKRLAREPFILFEEGFALNAIILEACRKRGFVPATAARSGQADFIMALVAAGLGVGFLPRLVVEVQRRLPIRAVPLDEADLGWHPGLAWRKGRPLSPAAKAWIAILEEPSF